MAIICMARSPEARNLKNFYMKQIPAFQNNPRVGSG